MFAWTRAAFLAAVCVVPTLVPGAALADKIYKRDWLASQSVRLEAKLKGAKPSGKTLAVLKRDADAAVQKRDWPAARDAFAAALKLEQRDWTLWRGFADANLNVAAGSDDWSTRYESREAAATAAYTAYQKAAAPRDEAAGLAMLGRVYQAQESWRSALDAYRASLKLDQNPTISQTWGILREKYGFRLTDYKLDSDAASPRVCFEFSESLARNVTDFAPYVVVQGLATPAISAEADKLCVDGLEHGKRYSVVIRQGLPSSVDEDLMKAADYDFYVKDRAPAVHFTGKNYVLPRTGQEGLPVVSVNTRRVDVDIYRIGDRNLISAVRGDDFLTNLSPYQAEELRDTHGVKLWSGALDVDPVLNKDVVTAFPVLEALGGKTEPGLYVMTAKAPGAKGDDYDSQATQWFVVSDFGLTAFSGDGGIEVLARSLGSAKPLVDVEVRLIARNNEVLQTRRTDADGRAAFDPGLARGTGGMAPSVVVATDKTGDYGFLDLGNEAFDLTDRGNAGLPAPAGLDAYVYAERGVYRTGETVNLTALVRDVKGSAVAGLPLTMVVERPDGVEYRRAVVGDQGIGGRAWSLPLISGIPTGTWRVKVYADPKRPTIGEATFLVEDYVAERLDLVLKPVTERLTVGQPAEVKATATYLYGAPGGDLALRGAVRVEKAPAATVPGLAGFTVGRDDETFESVTQEMEGEATTDEKGEAVATLPLPQTTASRPLQAFVSLAVTESGGRAVNRNVVIPIVPSDPVIGVRKLFADRNLAEGAKAGFEVVMAAPDGSRIAAKGLRWELKRVERRYQWFNSEGRWDYEVVKTGRRVADGSLDIAAGGSASLALDVDWGNYRLEVRSGDAGGPLTSVGFSVGWGAKEDVNAPDVLDVKLDKDAFAAGETMQVHLAPRFDGTATVMVVTDKVEMTRVVDVRRAGTTIDLPVDRAWGAGAYVLAVAHRPMDVAAHRLPGRAVGLAWFQVDRDARRLDVSLGVADKVRPRGALTIPVKLDGLAAGEEARVVVAAVDVGILNLTAYKTPDPEGRFFGQRVLSMQMRDLYGFLIDGMQGVRGAIRSGGDESMAGDVPPPREAPLARYSGVVTVGPDGTAQVMFDLPAFNGAIRVMAVAWSAGKVGHAEKDVVVRDPVVVQATLPRFLHVGDRSRLHLAFDNVEGDAGDYTVDLDVHGPLTVAADALRSTIKLTKGGRGEVVAALAGSGLGTGTIDLRLTGPGGIDARQSMILNVQPATPAEHKRTVESLAENGSLTLSADLAADYLPATGIVSLSVSPYGAFDVPALLKSLDRYPYGCSEQLVSRAMPLLYANQLAAEEHLALDEAIDTRVRTTIEKLLTRQDSEGDFGLWSADGDDIWLDAYVTDFLTRARERGFEVPNTAFESALDRLRNYIANADDADAKNGHDLAYAAYVLARNGRPIVGDLRYLTDNKLAAFTTPLGRAQLGAALALLGDRTRAEPVFASAQSKLQELKTWRNYRSDYGTTLRDGAAMMALMTEAGMTPAQFTATAELVDELRGRAVYTSTQEQAWMVLAATALLKDADKLKLAVDGAERTGPLYRSWRATALAGKPVTVRNLSPMPAKLVLDVSGNPTQPLPAAAEGYTVERSFHKLDGSKIDVAKVRQTDRLVVVLKVTEATAENANLLLVDNLPAGFEIDNPDLVGGSDMSGFDWLDTSVTPDHTEYRDDRFVATFNRTPSQSAFFHVAYTVRAVAPGTYVLPAATAEDMYRPWRHGRTAAGTVEVLPQK
jgi:uncharacterized protein YfaS (alpha-2-macroglobulin family)